MMHLSPASLLWSLVLLGGLASCSWIGRSEKDETALSDQDGDGVSSPEDCDDDDAAVNPDAQESCNGIDDNCDGQTDEGVLPTWYLDGDGDGYGRDSTYALQCDQPLSYVSPGGDCDDGDPEVNPGATEVCDGVDNDCDGQADDGSAVDAVMVYADVDGDGFGDGAVPSWVCVLDAGLVDNIDDCDDQSATSYPGAIELCGDGVDNDCDGVAESPCSLQPVHSGVWFMGEAARDYAGFTVASAGDMDDRGYDDLVISARGADDDAGAVYVLEGAQLVGLGGSVSLGDESLQRVRLVGPADDTYLGEAVAGGVDLNGDAYPDLAMGSGSAYGDNGGVWIWYGPLDWDDVEREVAVAVESDVQLSGTASAGLGASHMLAAVAGSEALGPVLVLGASSAMSENDSVSREGVVFFVPGSVLDGMVGVEPVEMTPAAAPAGGVAFYGEESGQLLGSAVESVGDIHGDGASWVAVAAPAWDGTGFGAGAVYLVSLNQDFFDVYGGTGTSIDVVDARLAGTEANDKLGTVLAAAGDVDGDGYDAFWVAAPGSDSGNKNGGQVGLFPGTLEDGLTPCWSGTVASECAPKVRVEGDFLLGELGLLLAGDGDVDGDGQLDLLVGSPELGEYGRVYVLLGPFDEQVALSDAVAIVEPADETQQLGTELSVLRAFDGAGDGFVVGAPDAASNAPGSGAALLILEFNTGF